MLARASSRSPPRRRAYRAAQQLARTDEVRSTLEELRASVQLSTLNQAWVQIDAGIRHIATYWQGSRERIPTAEEIVEMQAAVNTMWSRQGKEVVKRQADAIANLRDAAISKKVAKGVLKANHLNAALMVWAESKRSGHSQDAVAVTQIAVGRATRLQEVLDHLSARPATGEWDPVALHILYNRFNRLLRELLALVPVAKPRGRADSLVPKLEKGILAPVRAQVDALMQEGTAPSVASLLVLEERVAGAVARMQS
jgi:NAD-specific glutamate dehydrogenase